MLVKYKKNISVTNNTVTIRGKLVWSLWIVLVLVCPITTQAFTTNQAADIVIGQPDMTSNSANQGGTVAANTLNYSNCAFTDGERLFIADRTNHRILIYSTIPTVNNAVANIVIGQPDLTSDLANQGISPDANTLNQPPFVIVYGSKILIADKGNHRVLIYDTIPLTDNINADVVIGQPDMTSVTANQGSTPTARTLSAPHKICFDGTNLYICDYSNNRVLIYHGLPTANNDPADVVVGQPDMNSYDINQGGSAAANTLNQPGGVWSDGSKLYIADTRNHRVLIYNTIPTVNNAAADVVVGQSDMTSTTANQGSTATARSLNRPFGLYSNGEKLFIPDYLNFRVLIFNTIPTVNNAAADIVLGQPDMSSRSPNQGGSVAANTFDVPLNCYYTGRQLFVGDGYNNRILIFNETVSGQVYRSVGPNRNSALASGSGDLMINGKRAAFTGELSTIIGVGDVIQYDVNEDSVVDSLAFIESRINSSQFIVANRYGAVPKSFTKPHTDWAIYRAYTSLSQAEQGDENTGIHASLRDFDSGNQDLVNDDIQFNIACYADGADAIPIVWDGWTTDSDHTLRIFTPQLPNEVGSSQRHQGLWSNSAYHLSVSNSDALTISDNFIQLEGLQLGFTSVSGNQKGINLTSMTGPSSVEVAHCIIKGLDNPIGDNHGAISLSSSGSGTLKIWNNIIYNFNGQSNDGGIIIDDNDFNTFIYNNTLVNCFNGLWVKSGNVDAKNNIVQQCNDGYVGSFGLNSDYNISDSALDAPGLNAKNVTQVLFNDLNNDDLHLSANDSGALNQGMDLSGDSALPFSVDIDGEIRPRELIWDCGADESYLLPPTATAVINQGQLVSDIMAHPNPFRPPGQMIQLSYTLYSHADVEIEIYTYLGDKIKTLNYAAGQPGGQGALQGAVNQVAWDGRSSRGLLQATSGYICQLIIRPVDNNQVIVKKIKVALIR